MSRLAPFSMSRCYRELLRGVALTVGFVCLVAQFAAALHTLLVQHVRCAEHGEWVHVDEGHGPTIHVGRETPVEAAALRSSSSAEDHDHEHCLACAERKLVLRWPALSGVRSPVARRALVSNRRVWRTSSRIYGFAPKSSPPA